jgi:hypothetical protein
VRFSEGEPIADRYAGAAFSSSSIAESTSLWLKERNDYANALTIVASLLEVCAGGPIEQDDER